MFRSTIVALAAVVITSPIGAQGAGDHVPSDVTFNLRRSFLEELMTTGSTGHSVGARWKETLRMDQHSAVHQLPRIARFTWAPRSPTTGSSRPRPGSWSSLQICARAACHKSGRREVSLLRGLATSMTRLPVKRATSLDSRGFSASTPQVEGPAGPTRTTSWKFTPRCR